MQLLQVTTLFLLLSSLCSSKSKADVITTTTVSPPTISIATTSVTIPDTMSTPTPAIKPTTETSPKGTTNSELSKTPLVIAVTSLTTVKIDGTTSHGVEKNKNELITTKATTTNQPLSNAVSTLQTSQQKTGNQSSTKTTEKSSVTTQQPDTSTSKTPMLPSTPVPSPEVISPLQDTEDGKNASSSSTSPSYSSIILPVVIALIVITLSVFVLVGLYRMCWRTDPGTPENGNDQPQSDKESVKLLTVKTISHESGELSAAGKNKN